MPIEEQTPEEKLEEFRRRLAVNDLKKREGVFLPLVAGTCHVCRRQAGATQPLRAQYTTMTVMACTPCAKDLTAPEG